MFACLECFNELDFLRTETFGRNLVAMYLGRRSRKSYQKQF